MARIFYESFAFTKEERGRIGFSAKVYDPNAYVFTRITRLMDALEQSREFKDIDNRSFSKAKDEFGNFLTSLSLNFRYQHPEEEDQRDFVDLLDQYLSEEETEEE